jgi:hypothetical protein
MADSETSSPAGNSLAVLAQQQPISTVALSSDSYWGRVWQCIVWQTGEYVKNDFAYSFVAAVFVGLLTLVDGSATISTLYWSVIGFLAVFGTRLGQHAVSAPPMIDSAIRQELAASQSQLAELTRDKLVFEIDGENTTIRVNEAGSEQSGLVIRIWLDVQLRFENLDEHSTSMKRLNFTLHRGGSEIFAWLSVAQYSSNGIPINKKDIEGMMIQGNRLTPWYSVRAALTVADNQIVHATDLRDGRDYIALTMYAGGYQPPFTARLIPHWSAALEPNGTKQMSVTGALYIEKDYRRFD